MLYIDFPFLLIIGDKSFCKRDCMERIEGVKTSHESFSNFNFSIDRVGQRLVALPSNLSRPSVSRLSRSGPFTRKTWTSKRSAHGFLSNRHGSPSFVTEPIPEMPWLNRLDGDQWLQRGGRERERAKKVNGAPHSEELVCEKRSTLERKPRFQDNWHISKGEERKFSIRWIDNGLIDPKFRKLLLGFVNEKPPISRKKKNNNIYSNHKQR